MTKNKTLKTFDSRTWCTRIEEPISCRAADHGCILTSCPGDETIYESIEKNQLMLILN